MTQGPFWCRTWKQTLDSMIKCKPTQMRIALARLLLGPAGQSAASASGSGAGVLFLDEPTNHLDRAACKWLGTFLQSSSGGDGDCERML